MAMTNEQLISKLLLSHGPLTGLELVKLSGGQLKRGLVYLDLAQMEQKDHVIQFRRIYSLTVHRADELRSSPELLTEHLSLNSSWREYLFYAVSLAIVCVMLAWAFWMGC